MSAVLSAPTDSPTARFGSGRAVQRVEDDALLTGRGRFTDDNRQPGELTVMFLRSPHAHAVIRSVDAEAARALPGVVAVYSGAELAAAGVGAVPSRLPFQRPDGAPATSPPRRALAHERVRFAGEAVAMVVADNDAAALAALDAIFVDYDELPAVVDPSGALAEGAPRLWDEAPGNVVAVARYGDAVATEAAFARAAHRVSLDLVNQRLAPCPMEPRVTAARWDAEAERLVVDISSQMPTGIRDALVGALPGAKKGQIRVTVGDVGGGFGMKGGIHPEDIAVAYAGWVLKRPVKWCAQRLEEFLSAVHGRDQNSHAELALDADGRVLALRLTNHANVGAYAAGVGAVIQLMVGAWVSTSVYDIPLIDLKLHAVLTNTTPVGAYRGAGRPEFIYLIERLMEAAARALQLDPSEVRRRNFIRPQQMPYRNAMGQTYDVGQFERVMDQGLALADWGGFAQRHAESAARGKLRGRGLATFLEWTGGGALDESVTVRVLADGFIELVSATQAMGQGIATSYAQLAVDVFGVPIERIHVLQGDTDRATGFGSAGSRSLFTGGAAVQRASEATVDEARKLAGEALEVADDDVEYRDGRFTVVGTDLHIGLFDLAARQTEGRIVVGATASAGAPSWPNGCHLCEVEIDPDTGEVQVVAYASVNDIGRVVSPTIAQGQIEGGVMQGLGQALCEAIVHDRDSGQLLTASFMDYALPHADMALDQRTVFDQSVPCTTNLLGVKGVGELGTIGATPAAVHAVLDALHRAGHPQAAQQLQMPLTAPKLWAVLNRA